MAPWLADLLADAVLVVHAAFIAWVVGGGFFLARRPRLVWLHLPALVWGVWVIGSGSLCPLTPLEQQLRAAAGQGGYSGGFIEHYLTAAIYPAGLTRAVQQALAIGVAIVNLVAYALAWRAWRQRRAVLPARDDRT